MLSVKGQYYFLFKLGNKEDFIDHRNLLSFNLIESVGNNLPIFDLSFYSNDTDLIKLLNENNILTISLGKDQNKAISIELIISKSEFQVESDKYYLFYLGGYLNKINYINNNKKSIQEGSGVEVILKTAKNYFNNKVNSNIIKSSDKMNWVQPNISDRDFIDSIYLHCDLKDSFPVMAINSYSEFILHDFKKLLANKAKWVFTYVRDSNDKNIILYSNPPMFSINSGYINNLSGYCNKKYIHNMISGNGVDIITNNKLLLVNNKNFNKSNLVTNKTQAHRNINENVHSNYWISYLYNLNNLSLFSTVSCDLVVSGEFLDIKLLDKVIVNTKSLRKVSAEEYSTGVYIISKISMNLSNQNLTYQIKFNRENINI